MQIAAELLRNAMSLSNRELRVLKVSDVELQEAVSVFENEPALRLANLFTEKTSQ